MVIVTTNTIAQPHTVVIVSRDTGLAQATMLASRRLQKVAGRTFISWVEENPIKWVPLQLFLEI